ncbi:hypothetical protein [Consotaella aegiceratis]|uniref:hypothetical protein n=1 Tax=Consotaella aegiceratis TaxID=3097961 RepID=UPI002F419828
MSTLVDPVAVVEPRLESSDSAVSWAAIFVGAVAATALTLVLLVLGSGIGLSVVSPFSGDGVSATGFAVSAAIWLVLVQWLSAAFGGYLTGRLRTRWADDYSDEIYFRDTAHGFMSWALATIAVVWLLSSGVAAVISGGVQAASTVAGGAAQAGVTAGANAAASDDDDAIGYFTDMLFRAPAGSTAPNDDADVRAEAVRILSHDALAGTVSDEDRQYLAQLVSRESGLSEPDAQARVDTVLAQIDDAKQQAKQAADDARAAASGASLLTALSMVIGAFVAAVAAVIGGRQRHGLKELFI